MVTFSADGRLVGSVAQEPQEAFVWSAATGNVRSRISLVDLVEPVRFSPDGSTLYTAGSDLMLRSWDLTGRRQFVPRVTDHASIPEFDFRTLPGPSGRFVAYPSSSGVRFLDPRGRAAPEPEEPFAVTGNGTWAPDGVRFASPSGDGVMVSDARTGEVLRNAQLAGTIAALDFSTDGSTLAVTDSRTALLVDADTLQPLGAPVNIGGVPCRVALGPDNRTAVLATGLQESTWPFWRAQCSGWALVDLRSGAVLHRGTVGPERGIEAIDVSPSGDAAALALATGEVLELDLRTGNPLHPPIDAHEGFIFSLRYAPEGGRLVTSGVDASAAVWEAGTGRLRARVVTPTLFSLAEFSSDPSVLLADPSGNVYRWNTSLEYAIDFACRLAGRDLTRREWADQFGDRPFRTTCPA